MDSSLVFVRTASGEAALQQPTRLVQRNLRRALALVDGERDIADIAARFGDCAVGEAALADLQRSGLIETMQERRLRGEDITATATPPFAVEQAPAPTVPGLPSQVTDTDPRVSGGLVEVITIDDVGEGTSRSARPVRAAAARRAPSGSGKSSPARRPTTPARSAGQPHGERPEPAAGASVGAGERRINWAKLASGLMLAVALLVAAGIAFYPYQRHLPRIEQRLAAAIGQPVHIRNVHFSWLPSPNLTLENVSIGTDPAIVVGSLGVVPDPLSLFGERFVVQTLRIERSEIAARALPAIADWFSRAGAGGLIVRNIGFANVALRFGEITTDPMHGEGTMDRNGALRMLRFAGSGALSGELAPHTAGYRIKLSGVQGWAPDFMAPLAFDYFEAEGSLTADAMRLSKVYGRMADGSISGAATMLMNETRQLSAELEVKHVEVRKLLAQAKSDLMLQGSASGMVKVGGGTISGAGPGSGLAMEGMITVQHGVLDGFDLVEAARSDRNTVRGGATRFEAFSGQLRVDARAWQVSRMRLHSGLISADGQIAISGNQRVAGSVTVELRGSTGSRRVPLSVSGSVQNPVLSGSRIVAARSAAEPT
jgi:hypothetical protein